MNLELGVLKITEETALFILQVKILKPRKVT